MLKLGYKASAEQFAPGPLLDFSVLAEQVGFDSVFISDHFQPWKHTDGHAPFSMTWLGALGARTQRVVMGTSVLTPTFRYHPTMVAQAFGTLGAMFPGRVLLGIGTGESLNDVPATGMVWPEFKERFARMREAVSLMRRLWTEQHVTFEGQYYQTKDATIYDRPDQPVPIYVAAAGALVAKYAGRQADGFICTSGKASELYTETLLPNVQEGLKASGRDPARYDMMIEVKVSFARSPTPSTGARSRSRPRRRCRCTIRARWNGWPTRCRSSAPPSAGSSRPTPRSMSRRSPTITASASTISCSTRRGRISPASSSFTASGCCRCCARSSADVNPSPNPLPQGEGPFLLLPLREGVGRRGQFR